MLSLEAEKIYKDL